MHFTRQGILVRRLSDEEFWRASPGEYVSHVAVSWFPLNWITIPILAFRLRLARMQAEHFDE